jgi:hypothetical protein
MLGDGREGHYGRGRGRRAGGAIPDERSIVKNSDPAAKNGLESPIGL